MACPNEHFSKTWNQTKPEDDQTRFYAVIAQWFILRLQPAAAGSNPMHTTYAFQFVLLKL